MNQLLRCAVLLLTGLLAAPAWPQDAPADFAWHATLAVPTGASVARVTLPAEAMLHLQSSDARDVRVFNAEGVAVAHSFTAAPGVSPNPVRLQTVAYTAHPLFAASQGQRLARGAVEVRLDQAGSQSSAWVRFAGQPELPGTTAASPLPSALFDTRSEKQSISALTLQAELPANALIHFTLAASQDLAQWTPVPVRGPLFRFDGAGAPASTTLELLQPLPLEGHYLRLSWQDQSGVQVRSFTGSVAQPGIAPERVRAALPSGRIDGSTGMMWPIPFATPLAALQLRSTRDNTLIPVRILGRNDAAQPWRELAQAVVYRVGSPGQEKSNAAAALGGASVRWLRIEASSGIALPGPDLQATAEFEPIQLVFMASGKAPFELAVGRRGSAPSAVPVSLMGSVVTGQMDDLPVASLSNMQLTQDRTAASAIQRFLPVDQEPRSVVLWAVLLAAVLVLALVAYGLLRQLSAKPAPAPDASGST